MTGAEGIVPDKADQAIGGEDERGVIADRARRHYQIGSRGWVADVFDHLHGAGGASSICKVQINPRSGDCYRDGK